MSVFKKDTRVDGWPITKNGQALSKDEVVAMLNTYHDALDTVVNELESWNLTEGDPEAYAAIKKGAAALNALNS